MDKKRIIKNVLFVALVPSFVVAGYYGYKAYQNFKRKKEGEGEDESKSNASGEEKEVKVDVISEIKEEGKINAPEEKGKVIPITAGIEKKDEEKDIKIAKEA